MDIIIGKHSILEAIKNPQRLEKKLYGTQESIKEFMSEGLTQELQKRLEIHVFNQHDFQELSKKIYKNEGHEYHRIPSKLLLTSSSLPEYTSLEFFNDLDCGKIQKIFCLDSVTDVHNGAAVLRTCSFYGVHTLIISQKSSFKLSPSFFRIASGATEYVKILIVRNLSKTIKNLSERKVNLIGFSEHPENIKKTSHFSSSFFPMALIMGSEEKGLSHAVSFALNNIVALEPLGNIRSLNVSVASAVAMDRFFKE